MTERSLMTALWRTVESGDLARDILVCEIRRDLPELLAGADGWGVDDWADRADSTFMQRVGLYLAWLHARADDAERRLAVARARWS